MTNLPTRAGWIKNILKRVESRLGSDNEAVQSLRRDLDWARERDAEDAEHALRYPVKPPVVPFDPSMTPVHRMDVDYREGSLVKHTKRPEWGVGTVIADSTKESVQVLFEDGAVRTFGLPLAALVKVNV